MQTPQTLFPNWMRGFLLISAIYNLFWGAFIAWFPETFYQWVTESSGTAPDVILWQGRFVLLLGVGYFIAALHPGKYWYLIFVGLATKLAGAIWFYLAVLKGEVGKQALFHLIMNDGIWIPFFVVIGIRALQYGKAKGQAFSKNK